MVNQSNQTNFKYKLNKHILPVIQNLFKNFWNLLKWLLEQLVRTITKIVGHLQNYKYGYLVAICIAFIIATFLFIHNTSKIATQTIVVAESIKKIEELNNLNFQQSRQILLHVTFDMQASGKMQPQEFNDVPIFSGLAFNNNIRNSRFNFYIENESPFSYEGKIFINIGLKYFDKVRNEWILRTTPYQISRNLALAPSDLKKIEITDDLLNSGAFPTNLDKNEMVKVNVVAHFDDAFQPKVKITHRLSYY